ncbi:MAG: RNA polymerase factor sigma-32 [Hyphomonadaceae bacterium]|nr:MAG: RNA polymerase sigma-32 factor [Caulobacteraceae bacterium]MBT9446854.1 RNA polymerase factor sigma-32 [Hyphomonadaceae bacterium]TPW02258.1 MAG: RNA polymerase sigma-32 factor [Alphaproteobacteria bacterium]
MPLSETEEFQTATRSYARETMRIPMLGAEDETMLARRWRVDGDERALHTLTRAYLRLVVAMASRFRNYGLPTSELVQEGNVGLMQAAARFDPERGVRFSTYAAWWIRAAIQDYILRNWSIVRTGTTSAQKTLFFNLRRLRARINDTGEILSGETRAFVARKLKVSEAEVEAMAGRLSGPDRSLNAPIGEDGASDWQDQLADDHMTPDNEIMERRDDAARARWVAQALSKLSERERLIIRARRLEDEGVTLESLGVRLGVSKERVRQIEAGAMEKLRRVLLDLVGDPVAAGLI